MSLDYPCSGLGFLSLTNTTILAAHHLVAGSNITTSGSCQSSAITSVDICRVYGVINTTSDSAVKFELWLPDAWYGRFLGVGNGGLGGCKFCFSTYPCISLILVQGIDYTNIDYGTSLNFATIGSDNGHDGDTGLPFYNHPEVIVDYAHRAIHTEALIGKQITEAYYTRAPDKSYYLGCSTGGRQAMQAALLHPDDFDGIIGGAPAADFNHFIGSGGMLGTYIGAPNGPESPNYIPTSLWPLVSREILNQCDGIDGVVDGIITEPDDCQFDPTTLLCANDEVDSCLTQAQVEALVNVYEPLYGSHNQLLYSRYDPGAEADAASSFYFNGNNLFQYTNVRIGFLGHSKFSQSRLGLDEIHNLQRLDSLSDKFQCLGRGICRHYQSRGCFHLERGFFMF